MLPLSQVCSCAASPRLKNRQRGVNDYQEASQAASTTNCMRIRFGLFQSLENHRAGRIVLLFARRVEPSLGFWIAPVSTGSMLRATAH
jgi:hypothetical protein